MNIQEKLLKASMKLMLTNKKNQSRRTVPRIINAKTAGSNFFSFERAISVFFKNKKPYFLEVGANDGKTCDPTYKHAIQGSWPGLLVEPMSEAMAKLKRNYIKNKNVRFAEVAVAQHDGKIQMMRVDPAKEEMLGFFAPFIAEIKGHDAPENLSRRPEVSPHMIEVERECKTLKTIIKENKINKIDLVQIDTEGYDYIVLKQLDFKKFKPSIIHFEYGQLPFDERKAVKVLLSENGYAFILTNIKDMLAVPKDKLQELIQKNELKPYLKYLDDGLIFEKNDLIYALGLLGQFSSCLTSMGVVTNSIPIKELSNYNRILRDSGGPRKRDIIEAIDAIERMKPLFENEKSFSLFLENELPLYIISR
jgi:FkbM family methyltransferase